MRVNKRGQVTIPSLIRRQFGMVPGTEVECVAEAHRIYLRSVPLVGRGDDLVKRMAGKGTVPMGTDELLALTRGGR